MHSPIRFVPFAIALALLLIPAFASADEATLAEQAQRRVEAGLVKPLIEHEAKRSRFSRARLPPSERRIRVVQTTAILDAAGRPFVRFAVDVRYGSDWSEDIRGCVYLQNGSIFVKRGDAYRSSEILLGKAAEPAAGVCEAPVKRSA